MYKRNDIREYRSAPLFATREQGGGELPQYHVRGYASTFTDVYPVWDERLGMINEKIDPHAFDETDTSDTIFQIDHEGRVFGRTRNETIFVKTDEHGLLIEGDLSRTTQQRELWEDIDAGNYDKMSFGFTIADGGRQYDPQTNTQIITKIDKLYDISVVSFPANSGTEISARSRDFILGEKDKSQKERLEAEKRKLKLIKLKMKIGG